MEEIKIELITNKDIINAIKGDMTPFFITENKGQMGTLPTYYLDHRMGGCSYIENRFNDVKELIQQGIKDGWKFIVRKDNKQYLITI